MYSRRTLLKKFSTCTLSTSTGPWSRAVAFKYLTGPPPGAPPGAPPSPLWPGGAKQFGQRFTPKGSFDTAYLASDIDTAMREVGAVLVDNDGKPIPLAASPFVAVSVLGVVHNVLDVTDPAVQAMIGTTLSELTGAWAFVPGGGVAPTQQLGEAAYASGRIHAIRYNSVKNIGVGTCLAVFPDRLDPLLERLTVKDPASNLVDTLP